MNIRYALLVATCSCLCLLSPGLLAQEQPAAKKKAESSGEVAARQKQIGSRLGKLEQTMERLANLLAKQSPEQAAKLRLAWQRSKSDQNVRTIQEIEKLTVKRAKLWRLSVQQEVGSELKEPAADLV